MDYNQSCYWQSSLPICGYHHHIGSSTGFPPHGHVLRLDPRRCGGRFSRCLSPPTGVLCVRGRTCSKLGEVRLAESRRSAEGLRRDGSQRRSTFSGSYLDNLLRERWRLVGRRPVCRQSRRIQAGVEDSHSQVHRIQRGRNCPTCSNFLLLIKLFRVFTAFLLYF